MARDHGGPWQNAPDYKNNVSLPEAMASAKESFEVDIEADFRVIHIDPSVVPPNNNLSQKDIYERLFELGYLW